MSHLSAFLLLYVNCSKVSRKRKKERKKEREEAFLIFWAHQGDQVDMTAVQVCQTRKYVLSNY